MIRDLLSCNDKLRVEVDVGIAGTDSLKLCGTHVGVTHIFRHFRDSGGHPQSSASPRNQVQILVVRSSAVLVIWRKHYLQPGATLARPDQGRSNPKVNFCHQSIFVFRCHRIPFTYDAFYGLNGLSGGKQVVVPVNCCRCHSGHFA